MSNPLKLIKKSGLDSIFVRKYCEKFKKEYRIDIKLSDFSKEDLSVLLRMQNYVDNHDIDVMSVEEAAIIAFERLEWKLNGANTI